MTRKPPSGARHAPCLTHVAHDYVKSGWLCITTNAENVAWPLSNYVEAPATDDAPAVVRVPRDMQPVDRAADMVAFADHLLRVSMAHRSRELERLAIPAMTAADYAEPVDHLPDGRPVVRVLADHAYPGTGGVGLYASRPQYAPADDVAPEPVKARKARKAAPVPTPEPVQAPDPLTLCNACDVEPASPDSPAGYCDACERAAHAPEPTDWHCADCDAVYPLPVVSHAVYHVTEPEPAPEPVSIAPELVAPVLAVLPSLTPDGRPTCERCGQVFRKHGTGAEWHRVNRPDCAATTARPSIAS